MFTFTENKVHILSTACFQPQNTKHTSFPPRVLVIVAPILPLITNCAHQYPKAMNSLNDLESLGWFHNTIKVGSTINFIYLMSCTVCD